ncbi:MAG: large conductance mechanosensitive channel protein MscL [Actinomycetota bacterium]
MLQEFKDFLTRGNLITLAVGFIMGLAFAAIVSSFVNDIVMPIIAIPFGEPDFSLLTWTINGSVIAWGSFVTAAVIFVLTALAVFFFIVRPYNAYEARQAAEEEEVEPGPSETDLLTEIRDLLAR